MSTTYSVAIQYKKDLGYIEYDAEKKAATVVLDDEDGRRAVEKYLAEKHRLEPSRRLCEGTSQVLRNEGKFFFGGTLLRPLFIACGRLLYYNRVI